MSNDAVLVLVVITALAFDFTNGFHDTGNAMATSIATKALNPQIAVALSGVLNLVGAFLSLAVAATIASGLVSTKLVTLTVVAAGLIGGIIWNLLTWFFGIPSSSSHALIGGVIGSMLAAAGGHAVLWHGLVSKVVLPAVLSPVIAALVAATGTWLLYQISRSLTSAARNHGFRSRIMNSWINLTALWKIVVFGLIAGAGLPAIFAVGLYSLTRGPKTQTAGADSDVIVGGSMAGMIIAALCFLVVLAAIGWGIYEVYQIGHPAPAK